LDLSCAGLDHDCTDRQLANRLGDEPSWHHRAPFLEHLYFELRPYGDIEIGTGDPKNAPRHCHVQALQDGQRRARADGTRRPAEDIYEIVTLCSYAHGEVLLRCSSSV